jgi:hypothetical protein
MHATLRALARAAAPRQRPPRPPHAAARSDPSLLPLPSSPLPAGLEAQFYKCSVDGAPLSAELTGGGPAPIGCKKADLGWYKASARSIASDEVAHVRFLRAALGADAVQCPLVRAVPRSAAQRAPRLAAPLPRRRLTAARLSAARLSAQVDIGPAFAAAANAAFGKTLSPPFSPYAAPLLWLHGAYIFEDVGVTAYMGAAPFLANATEVLSAAAGILGVEAYHAGAIRAQLLAESNKKAYGLRVSEIVEAISKLRQKLGGGLDKGAHPAGASLKRVPENERPTTHRSPVTRTAPPPAGIGYAPWSTKRATIAPVDANGIIVPRTPAQVLAIVYGGGKAEGLFFPDGMNGNITSY